MWKRGRNNSKMKGRQQTKKRGRKFYKRSICTDPLRRVVACVPDRRAPAVRHGFFCALREYRSVQLGGTVESQERGKRIQREREKGREGESEREREMMCSSTDFFRQTLSEATSLINRL